MTAHTTELARLCVEGIVPFHCHERPQVCRGFNAAVTLRGVPEDEEDRRWMEVARFAAEILSQAIEVGKAADAVARVDGLATGRPRATDLFSVADRGGLEQP